MTADSREDRKQQLMKMWKDRKGQSEVLRLFHRALPLGQEAKAGMSIFEVILDQEFGSAQTGSRSS